MHITHVPVDRFERELFLVREMVIEGAFWNIDRFKQGDDPEIVIAVTKQHRNALFEQHLLGWSRLHGPRSLDRSVYQRIVSRPHTRLVSRRSTCG
jgi:hypothetical protein